MAELNPLRRRMIEDMKVRYLSPVTRRCYMRAVAKFPQYDIGDLQPHHLRYPEPGGVGGHQRRPVLQVRHRCRKLHHLIRGQNQCGIVSKYFDKSASTTSV